MKRKENFYPLRDIHSFYTTGTSNSTITKDNIHEYFNNLKNSPIYSRNKVFDNYIVEGLMFFEFLFCSAAKFDDIFLNGLKSAPGCSKPS